MQSIIKFENVDFGYNSTKVLHNINLQINKGELIGIVGSNGAGKTTFIRLLIGSLIPNTGKIQVFNTDAYKVCKSHTIGYVSQSQDKNKTSFPATVLEVVMMNLYHEVGMFKFFNNNHKNKAIKALELVGMHDFKDRLISDLSGGQRQRVMIAKSIVNMPHILVLDEPTTGVDETSSQLIYDLLLRLNEQFELTIIMISHDIKNLKKYCTHMYEIEYGKISPYNV